MKEIIHITVALTISCLIAATVMGVTFIVTAKAKKHNHHMNVQETMFSLLGYGNDKPAPTELKLRGVYRYIVEAGESKYLGYVVPIKAGSEEKYTMVLMNLEGHFVEKIELALTEEAALDDVARDAAVSEALSNGKHKQAKYADGVIVAKLGDKRIAYLLPGEFPGFKTFIQVILALNPEFGVIGLEIMEHEEDPGLGAEIVQEYFKNQFKGKTFEKVKTLNVVKEPLPKEYQQYLETKKWEPGMFSENEIKRIFEKYRDKDIYSITGATISSKAVSDGVKGITKKFAYRVEKLQQVLAENGIPATI